MSKKNSTEAKKASRIEKFLKRLSYEHNKVHYRKIDGEMYPYQHAPRDFYREYLAGRVWVKEGKGKEMFVMDEVQLMRRKQLQTRKKNEVLTKDEAKELKELMQLEKQIES